jgi:predicted peroxiredoxin
MKFLHMGSHGPEDPTRAGLPLFMAKGALEAGHTIEILLAGDAVLLFEEPIAANVQPVGLPSVKELLGFLRDNRIPVYG